MSLINYSSREINCKIVYYGPGLGGKTTNIQYVYDKLNPETKGKLVTLATEMDRTLFFDFLPLELGTVELVYRPSVPAEDGAVLARLAEVRDDERRRGQ